MKIVFMGTPDFSVPVLEALVTKHEVIAVYTQPPRPAGKGYKLLQSPVHKKAEELNIPVFTPVSLKKEENILAFEDLNADVAVVCAYGLILPKRVLSAPKKGCINVHASLLPRWRGAAPIQRAIEAGDEKSGVTIMQMDAGLDTGDMLLKGEVAITKQTTAQILHDSLAEIGAKLILEALETNPQATPQPTEGVTYAEKIKKEESKIDFQLPASQIRNKIMAFNPYPCAHFVFKGERIKVFEAEIVEKMHTQPVGEVLDDNLLVSCGNNTAIRLLSLQREGKKRLSATEFLKGYTQIKKGENIAL